MGQQGGEKTAGKSKKLPDPCFNIREHKTLQQQLRGLPLAEAERIDIPRKKSAKGI